MLWNSTDSCFFLTFKVTALCHYQPYKNDKINEWHSRRFDRHFGVETVTQVAVDDLGLDESQKAGAVEYDPSVGIALPLILESLDLDLSRYCFIDFGSGKGGILLRASEFPFSRVIGVEFSEQLVEVALENIAKARSKSRRCSSIHVLHKDAREFEYPEQPLILYLFNPFGIEVIRSVFENLFTSLTRSPRHVIIIYNIPVHSEYFDMDSRFKRIMDPRFKRIVENSPWAIFTYKVVLN